MSFFHRFLVSAIHCYVIELENPHFARELSIYDDAKKEMPDILTGLLKYPFMNLSKVSTLRCLQSAWYVALLSSVSVNWASAQSNQPTDEVLVQSGRLTQRQFDAPTSIFTIDELIGVRSQLFCWVQSTPQACIEPAPDFNSIPSKAL